MAFIVPNLFSMTTGAQAGAELNNQRIANFRDLEVARQQELARLTQQQAFEERADFNFQFQQLRENGQSAPGAFAQLGQLSNNPNSVLAAALGGQNLQQILAPNAFLAAQQGNFGPANNLLNPYGVNNVNNLSTVLGAQRGGVNALTSQGQSDQLQAALNNIAGQNNAQTTLRDLARQYGNSPANGAINIQGQTVGSQSGTAVPSSSNLPAVTPTLPATPASAVNQTVTPPAPAPAALGNQSTIDGLAGYGAQQQGQPFDFSSYFGNLFSSSLSAPGEIAGYSATNNTTPSRPTTPTYGRGSQRLNGYNGSYYGDEF